MLPVLTAAQNLYIQDSSAGLELNTRAFTPPGDFEYDTPADLFASGSGDEEVTYPSTGYIEDLYSEGNMAYLTISQYDTSPELYRVNVYIYPTLSGAVEYTHEEYLVGAASWAPVDEAGTQDFTAYITKKTVYFDGGIEYRTVEWANVAADANHYGVMTVPTDFSDAAYDYPLFIDAPAADQEGVYSVYVTGTIPTNGTVFTEFYSETDDGSDGIANDGYSVSYVFQDLYSLSIPGEVKTVRRYQEDMDTGEKIQRARSIGSMTFSGVETTKTITETVSITDTSYTSTVTQVTQRGTENAVTTITETSLTEASADSYTGEVTITIADTVTVYTASLSTTGGLTLINQETGESIIEGGYMPVALEEGQDVIIIDLPEGGTIEGLLTSGRINGIIKSGRAADIIIGPTYVQVIYNQNKHSR